MKKQAKPKTSPKPRDYKIPLQVFDDANVRAALTPPAKEPDLRFAVVCSIERKGSAGPSTIRAFAEFDDELMTVKITPAGGFWIEAGVPFSVVVATK